LTNHELRMIPLLKGTSAPIGPLLEEWRAMPPAPWLPCME